MHFINDYEKHGKYTGFPCLGVEWQVRTGGVRGTGVDAQRHVELLIAAYQVSWNKTCQTSARRRLRAASGSGSALYTLSLAPVRVMMRRPAVTAGGLCSLALAPRTFTPASACCACLVWLFESSSKPAACARYRRTCICCCAQKITKLFSTFPSLTPCRSWRTLTCVVRWTCGLSRKASWCGALSPQQLPRKCCRRGMC